MERNVGGYDRIARLVAGPVLLLVGIVSLAEILPLGLPVAAVALVVGAVFLVTGLVQQCPLNSLVGVNTCSR